MIKAPLAFRALGPIALLWAALVAGPAQAQDLKIGVVNFAALVEQSPQAQQIATDIEAEFAGRQRDLMTLQRELQTQQETFQRDSSVMGEQERLNLERQIRDGQRELQRAGNEFREDLNIRQNEEINKLQRSVLQIVQDYAREEEYDLIVAEALYFSSAIDITEDVLEVLQESQE